MRPLDTIKSSLWKWAGRLLAVGLVFGVPIAAPSQAATKKETKMVTRLVDTDIFAGTIKEIDLQKATIVVDGQLIQRKVIEKERPQNKQADTKTKKPAPPKTDKKPTSGSRLFAVSSFCKITPMGQFLKDLKPGQSVEVTFHEVSGKYVADAIAPAGTYKDY